ncbi:4-hydroxy-tetrahydrodipicolinate reductase [Agrococcus baldri]|uniref:4-hydroxy-tetrahydrodipicolinate reductase n=1 Tax=Agrococcus baldri TaxID=153730 RepID=A0AA87RL54_9MICO|nr:4-hydroxy-tetrahydrodipicolinate reductase [Agrococcus baldri]GEK81098.1 4-hydroxy-tetrahydrodipicolinate reductase [Agrococcus baldri]
MAGTRRVGIAGSTGRLGSLALRLVREADDLEPVEIDVRDGLELDGLDVIFDATVLAASARLVEAASEAGVPLVVATSGWTDERISALRDRGADRIRIVPNFSLGSVLETHLATIAAQHFEAVEVVEAHHDRKRDAPSGTATRTAEAIGAVRGFRPATPDEPGRGTIISGVPVHALRLPGVVARQEVVFGGTGETLTIRHDTSSSESYSAGILLALRAEPQSGVTVGIGDLLDLA